MGTHRAHQDREPAREPRCGGSVSGGVASSQMGVILLERCDQKMATQHQRFFTLFRMTGLVLSQNSSRGTRTVRGELVEPYHLNKFGRAPNGGGLLLPW